MIHDIVANINQSLNQETIELIADDYGVEVEEEVVINEEDLSIYFEDEKDDPEAIEKTSSCNNYGNMLARW